MAQLNNLIVTGNSQFIGDTYGISNIEYITTEPTADNQVGLTFVILESQPTKRYKGYIYIITSDKAGLIPSELKTIDNQSIIGNGNLTISAATTSKNGLMSSTDKSKLNGIADNANNYAHPTDPGYKHIPSGGTTNQILRYSSSGTAIWSNENNTTYNAATASDNGLMSSTDKAKLDGIAKGATKNTITIGTSAPSGGSNGDIYIQTGQPLADFVTEIGTSGNWTYKKWNSGYIDCWYTGGFTDINITEHDYSGFRYSDPITINLPFTLQSGYNITISGGSPASINFLKIATARPSYFSYWICCLFAKQEGNDVLANGNTYVYIHGKLAT